MGRGVAAGLGNGNANANRDCAAHDNGNCDGLMIMETHTFVTPIPGP